MHFRPFSFIVSIFLAVHVRAFRVTFYSGYQCRGARLGTGNYGYPEYPVCHDVPINAVSARIEREPNDREGYAYVAFWGECDNDLLASGDGNCVNFLGATKFSARPPPPTPPDAYEAGAGTDLKAKEIRAVGDAPWAAEQALQRLRLGVSDTTALGSLAPHFDPGLLAQHGFGHGSVPVVDGRKNDKFVPYGGL
ncbi:hypothetical protein MMYC01_207027 [Madurella mycetomatis]|uniref:Uncharacterized protein n=1 Tax=Madurella mycetomatis TaxID=100816 RepID=A0A175W269_9PEZI|nr:hypothetical protein MMYC01_207027 [Madurella mycetomatis]